MSDAVLRIEKITSDQPSLLLTHVDQLIRAILMQKRFNFTTRMSGAASGGWKREREKERERERERETEERERDRGERQRDRETETERDREKRGMVVYFYCIMTFNLAEFYFDV